MYIWTSRSSSAADRAVEARPDLGEVGLLVVQLLGRLVELGLAGVELGLHAVGLAPQLGLGGDDGVDLLVLGVDPRLQVALLVDVRLELAHLRLELGGGVLGGGALRDGQRRDGAEHEQGKAEREPAGTEVREPHGEATYFPAM